MIIPANWRQVISLLDVTKQIPRERGRFVAGSGGLKSLPISHYVMLVIRIQHYERFQPTKTTERHGLKIVHASLVQGRGGGEGGLDQ